MAGALDAFNANRRNALDDTQGLFDQQVQRQAGGLLAGGDYTGAAGALYGGGLLSQGAAVQTMGERQEDRAVDRQQKQVEISKAEQTERLKFLAHGATVLLSIPQAQRGNAYAQSIAPALKAMGADDATIQQAGSALDDASLQTFSGQVGKALEQFTLTPGSKRFDASGKLVAEAPAGPVGLDPDKNYYLPAGQGGVTAPAEARQGSTLFDALIQQESGGRPGVLGPETPYGRAEGLTQMLPATAQDMAQKLGVPWQPELMRGTSPEAADYQKKLGEAYFNEGLQKYGGDPEKALMYYHGGPDERIWGPKTRTYAREVLAKAGVTGGSGQNPPMAGGAGSDDVSAPAGMRLVQQAKPKTEDAPSGYRFKEDGTLTFIPGGPADPKNAKADAKPPTVAQDQAASFTYRVLGANGRLNALADEGVFKPQTVTSQLVRETDGVTRIVARTDADRRFLQAAQEWLAPVLRKDTGAAVTDSELATYMDIYIPRYEDSQAVMKQKAEARQDAMVALSRSAGKLYGERFGDQTFSSKYPSATQRRNQGGAAPAPAARPPLADIFGGRR